MKVQKAGLKIPVIEHALQDQGPLKSMEAFEYATLEWVDWFSRRLLEPIGNIRVLYQFEI